MQVFYLCKKVAFRLAYLLRSRLFAPMPVVQVAGMEQAHALQIYQERDAYIGGAEGFDTDIFVFVDIPLIYVNGIFRRGTPVFRISLEKIYRMSGRCSFHERMSRLKWSGWKCEEST